MRALCAQTVLRFPAPDAASYEDSLARARDFIAALARPSADRPGAGAARAVHLHAGDPARVRRAGRRVRRAAPHPPGGNGARGRGLAARARHAGRAVGEEAAACSTRKVLAAHCVHVDEGEMRALKNAGAGVAHNPTSNLKLGAGVAPVARMLELGVDVGIGTDGAGVEQRPRHVRGDAAGGAAREGDRAAIRRRCRRATRWRWRRGSARARCTSVDLTGSLEPGKRADLIVVDLDRLHNVPAFARDPGRRLRADRLRREVDRRRRRDVQRPLADARSRGC